MPRPPDKADRITAESTYWALEEQSIAQKENDVIDGLSYVTGNLFEGVGNQNDVNLLLRNPSDSGEALFTTSTPRTGDKFYTRKIKNVTVSDPGNAVNIVNERTDTGVNTSALATIEPTVDKTAGESYPRKVVTSGAVSTHHTPFNSTVLPGDNILWELVNQGGGNKDASIEVEFTAIDEENL